jgi:hypothetical protein
LHPGFSTRARTRAGFLSGGLDELDRLSGPTDFTVAEVPLRVLGWSAGAAAS